MPPFGQPYSLLSLSNNTCIKDTFTTINNRFQLLYKRKAHLHHYSSVDNMDLNLFNESIYSLNTLIQEYKDLEKQNLQWADSGNSIERVKVLS